MFKLKIWRLICLFPFIVQAQLAHPDDPRLKIDYWLQRHIQLAESPGHDLAQKIFSKLLAVADKPIGVLPKLYIFSDLKFGKLCALPDGAIILPLRVIEFCQRNANPRRAESRLAFVLGHELKHVVRGDYAIAQILRFDQPAGAPSDSLPDHLEWQRRKILETEADEFGILYASLAGYETRAIDADFISSYYDAAGLNLHGEQRNNSPQQRLQAMQQRLAEIVEHLDLFDYGVRLHAMGRYEAAITLLEKFCSRYPSREVFSNLGLCYYQKARGHYEKWKHPVRDHDPHLTFPVSIPVDVVTRLAQTRLLAAGQQQLFEEAIAAAIKNFEEAKARDANYELALNHLGCAYLLKGDLDFAKGNFKTARKLNPYFHEAHNNMGVLAILEGDTTEAIAHFSAARTDEPDFLEPLYNLGMWSYKIGRRMEAGVYFKKYLQKDSTSIHAGIVRKYLGLPRLQASSARNASKTAGQQVSAPGNLSRGRWNQFLTPTTSVSIFHAAEQDTEYFHLRSKSSPEKISILLTLNTNQSAVDENGLNIGAPSRVLEEKYPHPHAIKPTTRGAFWVYEDRGLVVEMRDQKIYNWYRFRVE